MTLHGSVAHSRTRECGADAAVCNACSAATVMPQPRQVPNEAEALADEMEDFHDFDWGEFDMQCQAVSDVLEQKASIADIPQGREAILQDASSMQIEPSAPSNSVDDLGLSGDRPSTSNLPNLMESQCIDCKTTNKGIKVHK